MTKIYEALRNAGRERAGAGAAGAPVSGTLAPRALQEKLLALCNRMEALLDREEGGRAVQFMGVQSGQQDSSRLVCETAKLATVRLRKALCTSHPGCP